MRPALTDFARLAAQDFPRDPDLKAAFLEGYGGDPRTPDTWYRTRVREAAVSKVRSHLHFHFATRRHPSDLGGGVGLSRSRPETPTVALFRCWSTS
jgi:hypothetical protein